MTLDIPALGLQLNDEVQWRKEFVAWNASLPMPDTQLEPMQLAVVIGMRLRRHGIGDEAVNARKSHGQESLYLSSSLSLIESMQMPPRLP